MPDVPRPFSACLACGPDNGKEKFILMAKQVEIHSSANHCPGDCDGTRRQKARMGIVPVMAVGKNITLAALNKFTGGISQLDDAERKCILGINSATES